LRNKAPKSSEEKKTKGGEFIGRGKNELKLANERLPRRG